MDGADEEDLMQPQHPDDRFPLTQHERDEFERICQGLAGPEPSPVPARSHPGRPALAVVCTVFVFIGLAANSVVVVLLATAGAVAGHLAGRGHSAA